MKQERAIPREPSWAEKLATALEQACDAIEESEEQGAFEWRRVLVQYRDREWEECATCPTPGTCSAAAVCHELTEAIDWRDAEITRLTQEVERLTLELDTQRDITDREFARAEAERERCARICDGLEEDARNEREWNAATAMRNVAAAIRKG